MHCIAMEVKAKSGFSTWHTSPSPCSTWPPPQPSPPSPPHYLPSTRSPPPWSPAPWRGNLRLRTCHCFRLRRSPDPVRAPVCVHQYFDNMISSNSGCTGQPWKSPFLRLKFWDFEVWTNELGRFLWTLELSSLNFRTGYNSLNFLKWRRENILVKPGWKKLGLGVISHSGVAKR